MKKHNKNSVWNRLKRSFLVVLCLPILGLGSYMVFSSIRFVRDERILEAGKLIDQNILDLENRMEQCEKSLIYVTSNYMLQEFLQMDESDYFRINQASQNVGPLLYNAMLSNQYYKKLQIYSEKQFSALTDLIKGTEKVEEEAWYQKTLGTEDICWWYVDGRVFLSKRIQTAYPVKTIGVIWAEMKDSLFSGSFQIFENVPVTVSLNSKAVFYQNGDREDGYYVETRQLLPENWSLEYEISKAYFYPSTLVTLAIPMVVIVLVLLLAMLTIRVILRLLVKEVDHLVAKVEEVKKGDLDVVVGELQTAELNILAVSINDMLAKIRQLIEKVYQKEIEQKELELEMLRSRISPHFLYNNLSAINWLAIEREEDDIYEITTQMAAFYRTALNKGKTMDRLRLEIINVQAYIKLQLIAHEDSFDVEYEIDESLLDCVIPTFILQPLVENSIEHGTDLLRDARGRIVIRVFREKNVLYLQVEDNGTALYREIGDGELEEKRYGYGTGNVHRRIRLVHGEGYGLKIHASQNGTLAQLRLKIDEIGVTALTDQEKMKKI